MRIRKKKSIMRKIILVLVIIININILAGCWDYVEVEDLTIVAGAAVDKGENDDYILTVELIKMSSGSTESIMKSKIVVSRGKTIFEAVRKMVGRVAPKLYWSHIKVFIISKEIAKEGVLDILDWISRDHESRLTINLVISKGETASEILKAESIINPIHSFEICELIKAQEFIAHAPDTEIYNFLEYVDDRGIDALIPTMELKKIDGLETPLVTGMAIFKRDKLVGFLDEKESIYSMILLNEMKNGIIALEESSVGSNITLEIMKSKTKLAPKIENGEWIIEVNAKLKVTIAEINANQRLITMNTVSELEKDAGKYVEENLSKVIDKMQKEYKVDIYGFGQEFQKDWPKEWKKVQKEWISIYENQLNVNVSCEVEILNAGSLRESLRSSN